MGSHFTVQGVVTSRGPSISEEPSVQEAIYQIFQNKERSVAERYGQMVEYGKNQILDSGHDTAGANGAFSGIGRFVGAKALQLAGGLGWLAVRAVEAVDNAAYEFSVDYDSGLDVAVSEAYIQGVPRLVDAGKAIGVSAAFVLTDMWRKPPQVLSAYRHGDMIQMRPARALDQIVGPFVDGALFLVPILGAANALCEVGVWGTAPSTAYRALTTGGLVPVSSGAIDVDALAVAGRRLLFSQAVGGVEGSGGGGLTEEQRAQIEPLKAKMKDATSQVDDATSAAQERIRELYSRDPENVVEDSWTQKESLPQGVSEIQWEVKVHPRQQKASVSGNVRVRVDDVTVILNDGSKVRVTTKRAGNAIERRTVVSEAHLPGEAKLLGEMTTTTDARGVKSATEHFGVSVK